MREWREAERAGDPDYAGINEEIEIARLEGEEYLVAECERMGRASGSWQAPMTMLERTRPERYSRIDHRAIAAALESRERELGERVLARLPVVLARLGLSAERAPEVLDGLLGEETQELTAMVETEPTT